MESKGLLESLIVVIGVILITAGLGEFLSTLLHAFVNSPSEARPDDWLEQQFLNSGISLVVTSMLGASVIILRRRFERWFGSPHDIHLVETTSLIYVGVTLIGIWYLASGTSEILDLLQLRLLFREVALEYYRVGIADLIVGLVLVLTSYMLRRFRRAADGRNAA